MRRTYNNRLHGQRWETPTQALQMWRIMLHHLRAAEGPREPPITQDERGYFAEATLTYDAPPAREVLIGA